MWCTYTCSPNQATFLEVNALQNATNKAYEGKKVVNTSTATLATSFAEKMWNSCKNVQFTALGKPAVQVLFGSDTYEEWFTYMGQAWETNPNGHSPYLINFNYASNGLMSMNNTADLKNCNQTDAFECSCIDCPKICPPAPPAQNNTQVYWNFFNVKLRPLDLILGITFLAFLLVLIASSIGNPDFFYGDADARVPNDISHPTPAFESLEELEAEENTSWLSQQFYKVGVFNAKFPFRSIGVAFVVCALFSIGLLNFGVILNPVKLWAAKTSSSLADLHRFDDQFGAFYRIEQIFFQLDPDNQTNYFNNGTLKPILTLDTMLVAEHIMNVTTALSVMHNGNNITYQDLCNKPLAPFDMGCVIQAPNIWYDNQPKSKTLPEIRKLNKTNPAEAEQRIKSVVNYCSSNVASVPCMGALGAPIFPYTVLGGYPRNSTKYEQSTVISLTFLLNNNLTSDYQADAIAWEAEWLKIPENGVPGYKLAYSAGNSVEWEVNADNGKDAVSVILSYVAMFIYIGLAMGKLYSSYATRNENGENVFEWFFIHSKFFLGVCGVFTVIISILAASGICSLFGVQGTMVIFEVIPFLVLAIGTDNMFIILNRFHNTKKNYTYAQRMGTALSDVGLSITLSAMSEAIAFFLGDITGMPAVQSFAIFSGVSILVAYCLQMTMFSAFVVIDARREDQGRIDCLPCGISYDEEPDEVDSLAINADIVDQSESLEEPLIEGNSPLNLSDEEDSLRFGRERMGMVKTFMHNYWSIFVLNAFTKVFSIIFFALVFVFSLSQLVYETELGLDQREAMPKDSYLQDYFNVIADDLRVGPPVYFVVEGRNYSQVENQNMLCGLPHCDANSLEGVINQAVQRPQEYWMAVNVQSWIDDYLTWLMAPASFCCWKKPKKEFIGLPDAEIPSGDEGWEYCDPNWFPNHILKLLHCRPCMQDEPRLLNGTRPNSQAFEEFLPWFLKSECTNLCGLCGTPNYPNMNTTTDNATGQIEVRASRFMGFHSTLSAQSDYINALAAVDKIVAQIQESEPELDVYAYSIFYVFFQQYLTIWGTLAISCIPALVVIFGMSYILLKDFKISCIILFVIICITNSLLGVMTIWNISLNALSLVNIVMCIGISVEFCIHICVEFLHAKGSNNARARIALIQMGSSVIQGIFCTKFVGVFMLAFASSSIFDIYYFRMYFIIVISAGLHGMLLLPILLTIFGTEDAEYYHVHQEELSKRSRPKMMY